MLKPLGAARQAADFETALETDAGLMRLYSCIWYVSFGLFVLWFAYAAWYGA
jgi:hypothetical protein